MNASGDILDNPQLLRERSRSSRSNSTGSTSEQSASSSGRGGSTRRINSDRHAPKEQRYAELAARKEVRKQQNKERRRARRASSGNVQVDSLAHLSGVIILVVFTLALFITRVINWTRGHHFWGTSHWDSV